MVAEENIKKKIAEIDGTKEFKNKISEIVKEFTYGEVNKALYLIEIGKTGEKDLDQFSCINKDKMLKLLSYDPEYLKSSITCFAIKEDTQSILNDMNNVAERMRKKLEAKGIK